VGRHDEWVARDAAVVWHGFTQMDAFAENAPVLVERGEGNELIELAFLAGTGVEALAVDLLILNRRMIAQL